MEIQLTNWPLAAKVPINGTTNDKNTIAASWRFFSCLEPWTADPWDGLTMGTPAREKTYSCCCWITKLIMLVPWLFSGFFEASRIQCFSQFELILCYMFYFSDHTPVKSYVAWEKTSQVFVKTSFPVAHQNPLVLARRRWPIPFSNPLHLWLRSHQLMQGISHGKCHNLGSQFRNMVGPIFLSKYYMCHFLDTSSGWLCCSLL